MPDAVAAERDRVLAGAAREPGSGLFARSDSKLDIFGN
jgi:hypothetical protein